MAEVDSAPSDARADAGALDSSPDAADGGSRVDGGRDGGIDTGPITTPGVAVFVAQGHVGRTLVSCDEGRTWVADQSDDDAIRCFGASDPGFDCDHHEGAGNGLTSDGELWFATFGWGPPGGVRRSSDGVEWTEVLTDTTLAGIAAGQGAVVGGGRSARRTVDQGETWEEVETTLRVGNARSTTWLALGEGIFVITGESGEDRDVTLSDDGGATWRSPETLPAECASRIREVTSVGDTLVILGNGVACVSDDRGANFTAVPVAAEFAATTTYDGEIFAYARDADDGGRIVVHRSTDGREWSRTPIVPNEGALRNFGRVSVSPEGVFVGAGGWGSWYDSQSLFRSEDGVNWELLEAGAYVGGHPIRDIEAGRLPACPE